MRLLRQTGGCSADSCSGFGRSAGVPRNCRNLFSAKNLAWSSAEQPLEGLCAYLGTGVDGPWTKKWTVRGPGVHRPWTSIKHGPRTVHFCCFRPRTVRSFIVPTSKTDIYFIFNIPNIRLSFNINKTRKLLKYYIYYNYHNISNIYFVFFRCRRLLVVLGSSSFCRQVFWNENNNVKYYI